MVLSCHEDVTDPVERRDFRRAYIEVEVLVRVEARIEPVDLVGDVGSDHHGRRGFDRRSSQQIPRNVALYRRDLSRDDPVVHLLFDARIDDAGVGRLPLSNLTRQFVSVPLVVVVEECDELTVGEFDPSVTSGTQSFVLRLDLEDQFYRILRRHVRLGDGLVDRDVRISVYDDMLDIWIVLPVDRPNRV